MLEIQSIYDSFKMFSIESIEKNSHLISFISKSGY